MAPIDKTNSINIKTQETFYINKLTKKMRNAIVKFFKYVLRAILWIILALLIIWLSRSDRNLSTYISLLNQTNISEFKWWKILEILLPNPVNKQPDSLNINSTWNVIIQNEDGTGLNVYDPKFEEDMQNISLDTMLSWSEKDFWFKPDSGSSSIQSNEWNYKWTNKISDPQKELLELIRQQEMKK